MIQGNYSTLAAQLQGIRDPRKRRGQSYEWQYLLLIVASAVMAGQRGVRGMAQWAAEQGPEPLKTAKDVPFAWHNFFSVKDYTRHRWSSDGVQVVDLVQKPKVKST